MLAHVKRDARAQPTKPMTFERHERTSRALRTWTPTLFAPTHFPLRSGGPATSSLVVVAHSIAVAAFITSDGTRCALRTLRVSVVNPPPKGKRLARASSPLTAALPSQARKQRRLPHYFRNVTWLGQGPSALSLSHCVRHHPLTRERSSTALPRNRRAPALCLLRPRSQSCRI